MLPGLQKQQAGQPRGNREIAGDNLGTTSRQLETTRDNFHLLCFKLTLKSIIKRQLETARDNLETTSRQPQAHIHPPTHFTSTFGTVAYIYLGTSDDPDATSLKCATPLKIMQLICDIFCVNKSGLSSFGAETCGTCGRRKSVAKLAALSGITEKK